MPQLPGICIENAFKNCFKDKKAGSEEKFSNISNDKDDRTEKKKTPSFPIIFPPEFFLNYGIPISYLGQLAFSYYNPLFGMMALAANSQPMEENKVGIYTKSQRSLKILKYKERIQKFRDAHPIKKNYGGRSRVAKEKPRLNGKFARPVKENEKLNSNGR